jgi:hypothetical protein
VDRQQAEAAGLAEEVKVECANVCAKRHEVQHWEEASLAQKIKLGW